jgi:hypothetical protein
MSCTRSIVAALLLSAACTIQRDYVGNEFKDLPEGSVVVGQTTKREILEQMGPPDRILRQYDGDVFVYAYIRRNATIINIEEPVITNLLLFSYQKTQEKSDRLVVFFDRQGFLSGLGYRRGTLQLERF